MKICWFVIIFMFGFKGDVGYSIDIIDENSFRLVNGSTSYEGRVEVYHEGQWGSICDHYWEDIEGELVCKELGYSGVDDVYSNAYFGEGSGIIWLGGIYCTGYEYQFIDCMGIDFGYPNCDHSKDVGVRCRAVGWIEGDLRLTGGVGSHEGRVQVYRYSEWGGSSDPHFGYNEAMVVCRQLGFHDGVEEYYEHSTPFEEYDEKDTTRSWIGGVDCDGREDRLSDCDVWYNGLYYQAVFREPDQLNGVVCNHNENSISDGNVRLVDGDDPSHGRVQIYLDSQWGTICNDGIHFGYDEAYVICRSLGYRDVEAYDEYDVPAGFGRIYLELLDCDGKESSILYCDAHQLINYNCDHLNDAVIRCTSPTMDDEAIAIIAIGVSAAALFVILFVTTCIMICKGSSSSRGSSSNNTTIQSIPNPANIPAPTVPYQTAPSYANHLSTYASQQPPQQVFDPVGGHPAPLPTGIQTFTPQHPGNMAGHSSDDSGTPAGPQIPAPPDYHVALSLGAPVLGAPPSGYPSPGAPVNYDQGIVSQHPLATTHHDDPLIQYHVPVPNISQPAAVQQVYNPQQQGPGVGRAGTLIVNSLNQPTN